MIYRRISGRIKAEVRVLIYFHGYEVKLLTFCIDSKFHYVHSRIQRGGGVQGVQTPEKSQKYRVS